VLDPALLPARDSLVTGDTERSAGLDEQTGMVAPVGVVAGRAPPLGDRGVHGLSIEPLNVPVTASAQRAGPIAEQLLESGDVGVVTGAALPGRDRGVGHRGALILEVVAPETELLLVDVVPRGRLGTCRRGPAEEADGEEGGAYRARTEAPHGVPPAVSGVSTWQTVQSPPAKGMCTSGRSIPAI
jgi:hypothetical protein